MSLVQPAPTISSSTSHASSHLLPRRFIGPLPEVVVNSDEVLDAKSHLATLKSKAVKQGSKVKHKLQRDEDKWRIPHVKHDKRKRRKDVWTGTSFDVGREFNLGEAHDSTEGQAESVYVPEGAPKPTLVRSGPSGMSSTAGSYQTARTHLAPSEDDEPEAFERTVSSTTPLVPRERSYRRLKSVLKAQGSSRGASKSVQFDPTKGDASPADPNDVLERSGGEVNRTSAGVVEAATGATDGQPEDELILPGSVLMRDRMLVRVGYHPESGFQAFDEHTQRRQPARLQPLEEYIVVWRKGRIELYQEWTMPLKERIRKSKRLCFVIPLSPSRSALSIFNSTDLSFTLTTSVEKLAADLDRIQRSSTSRSALIKDRVRTSKQVEWLKKSKTGTNVFVFKPSTRSRAVDWYWEIWRELGGELSDFFEVQVPSLSTAVRLYLPQNDHMVETYQAFTKAKVVQMCLDSLEESVDLSDLQRQHDDKLQLELAWRGDGFALDWVSDTTTIDGKPRDWAVLAGLALIQHERATFHLQLRQAHHQPTKVQLADRSTLVEPPAVEGYLTRLKKAAKQQVYFATHDGNLFCASSHLAFPPMPPEEEGSSPRDLYPDAHELFLHREQTRASRYIQRAEGFIDLRDVSDVRLDDSRFELDLRSGQTLRLQCHSDTDATEWVSRLKSLAAYWTRRHRLDARLRMDVSPAANAGLAHTAPSDEIDDMVLADVWNWCFVQGCRPAKMAGRVFIKRGQNQFRSQYVILTGGFLVQYSVEQASFHQRQTRHSLWGAYVYSGLFAAEEVAAHVQEDAWSSEHRVYQDGMITADGADDTTFCIRLAQKPSRWIGSSSAATSAWDARESLDNDEANFVPTKLSKQPDTLLIVRTRSKLERDRWVWGINAEIERHMRAHPRSERSLRMSGQIPDR